MTRIDFLWWAGCPSHPEARDLLHEIVQARGVAADVEEHEVTWQGEAERLAFPGSPTIRVDGVDVDPAGAGGRAMLACRIYRLPDGRISPVPSREQLEAALL